MLFVAKYMKIITAFSLANWNGQISYDTSPSTFDRAITSITQEAPFPKRTKVSEGSGKTTIASLVGTKAYTTVEELVQDVETAMSSLDDDLQMGTDDGKILPSIQEAGSEASRGIGLRKALDNLILRELIQRPQTINSWRAVKREPSDEEDANTGIDTSGDNVLTLLGNVGTAQHSKQLFTSIRQPGTSQRPINELALPNGITSTKNIPKYSLNDGEDAKPVPTIGDQFPPPVNLPALNPPKPSRHTTTRSSSVSWYNPAEVDSKSKSNRRDSYSAQALSTGQWLTYNTAPSPAQVASPESKRKQRDRALSFGESQPSLSQESIVAHNQAKEDALFRSVYSSFAPDRDDSGAIVAEEQKNRMWWRKHGEHRYRDLLASRDCADITQDSEVNSIGYDEEFDEDDIKKAVDEWNPDGVADETKLAEGTGTSSLESSEEVNDILQEVSELLETLDSHQRVRNLTIPTNSRSVTGQNPQLATMSESPTSPSSAEFDIYEMLKDQLTLIVSTLPPYLLAKLDGEKLGALKISTKIHVDSKYQNGNLADDSVSASGAAKAGARGGATTNVSQAASAYANLPARSSSYYQQTATPAQQYPRSTYASQPAGPRQTTGSSSYQQNQQYANRPTASTFASNTARSSYSGQGSYPPQRAASSSADRYSYGQQYGPQQSQSSYGSYANGYRAYASQNAGNYNYNQQYSTPQARTSTNTAAGSQAYRGTQSEFPQRVAPPQGYGYGSAPNGSNAAVGRSASPQEAPRSSLPGQGQAVSPPRPQMHHQHSSQYQAQTPKSPQVNGTDASGSGAQQTHMTADEQAAVMNRQKAQLAERQGSGTPPIPALGNHGQQDGMSAPQPNGITAGQGE